MSISSASVLLLLKNHFKTGLFLGMTALTSWEIYSWLTTKASELKSSSSNLSTSKLVSPKETSILADPLGIREVLFFRSHATNCKQHIFHHTYTCKFGKNCSAYNLRLLLKHLNSVTEQLDVCLFHLTIRVLSMAIYRAHIRGVKVRVITDCYLYRENSQMPFLKHTGVPFRMQKSDYCCMHNKFVILDKKILMSGSLNWTIQGMCGNWDNLVIMSNPNVVQAYVDEFEFLWDLMAP